MTSTTAPTMLDRIAPIATALGAGWVATPDDGWHDGVTLTGPGGEQLHATVDDWRKANAGRLFLRGSFPDELAGHLYGTPATRISVDGSRSPEAIARDIERRLLPAYREALAIARQRKAESDEVAARRHAVMLQILTAMGGDAHAWCESKATAGEFDDAVRADVEVSTYRERAEFTVTVPWGLAPEVARLIGELRGRPVADPDTLF